MPLPVSIVVPRTSLGEDVFLLKCLPSIRYNMPAEILEEPGDLDICTKRKAGAEKARQPYLMFVDENVLLYEWALNKMARTLDEITDVAFVYGDCRVFSGKASSPRKSKVWDIEAIKIENYIGIVALMRREAFPLTADLKDPSGHDLWTALAAGGHRGLYISESLYEVYR